MDYEKEEILKRRRKERQKKNVLFYTMFSMMILLAVLCIFLLYFYQREKNKVHESAAENQILEKQMTDGKYISKYEVNRLIEDAEKKKEQQLLNNIQKTMEEGNSTITLLENLFPDKIVIKDSEKYYFFDVNEELEKNPYLLNTLKYPAYNKKTGEYEGDVTLAEENEIHSRKGLDVSKFQGDINWEKVAEDGIEFAYIRLGYRGYESGKIILDEKYVDNVKECSKAGIDTGVYFFTEAVSEREAVEEADFVLENMKSAKIELPVVIDVERSASRDSRTKNVTKEERTEIIKAFCNRITDAGHEVMIYGDMNSFFLLLNIDELEGYNKWVAYYHYPFRFPYKVKQWQYTANGKVNGIEGVADINIEFY